MTIFCRRSVFDRSFNGINDGFISLLVHVLLTCLQQQLTSETSETEEHFFFMADEFSYYRGCICRQWSQRARKKNVAAPSEWITYIMLI